MTAGFSADLAAAFTRSAAAGALLLDASDVSAFFGSAPFRRFDLRPVARAGRIGAGMVALVDSGRRLWAERLRPSSRRGLSSGVTLPATHRRARVWQRRWPPAR